MGVTLETTKKLDLQKKVLLFIVGAFWFCQYVYVPYQVIYLQSKGIDAQTIGLVVGAYGVAQVFLRIPFGMFADHAGRHKKIILAGVLCAGIASLFRIFIPNAVGYFIANLLSGTASATWISFMVLYLSFFENTAIQSATGKILAANNLGIFLGFLISSIFCAKYGISFLCLLGVLVSIAAVTVGKFLKDNKLEGKQLPYYELIKTGKNKRLIFFALLALVQQGVQMATCMSFTPQIAKSLGATGWEIGMTSIVYIIFAVLFSFISSKRFFMKLGYQFWVPFVMVIHFMYCILVPNMKTVMGIYACQILAGMSVGFLFTSLTSESMFGVPANRKSTAMGFFQSIYAIGMTLFPMIAGKIQSVYNMKDAYYFLSIFTAIGFVCSFIYYIKEKKYRVIRLKIR